MERRVACGKAKDKRISVRRNDRARHICGLQERRYARRGSARRRIGKRRVFGLFCGGSELEARQDKRL